MEPVQRIEWYREWFERRGRPAFLAEFAAPVLVFFQAGNVTDATGGTSPGSSWGILVLILGGLLVGLVASLGLVCRAVLDHQARVAAQ